MLPLKSPSKLELMTQGQVNVIKPKLSTVPDIVPSLLETMPLVIIMKRSMGREPEVPPPVGNRTTKLYVPSYLPAGPPGASTGGVVAAGTGEMLVLVGDVKLPPTPALSE
jgi:hypothetical protein